MIELALALGLISSLFFVEAFGIAAGGIVVPGYFALQLSHFDQIAATLVIAGVTSLIVKVIGRFTFLYGRRQMVFCLLVGSLLAIISHHLFIFDTSDHTVRLAALGWVVPGLIAHWIDKQGVIKTVGMLLTTSIVVRFVIIVFFNGALIP